MAVRLTVSGNQQAAYSLRRLAFNRLEILEKEMSFRNLFQDQRTLTLADGTVIKCRVVGCQKDVGIYVPVVPPSVADAPVTVEAITSIGDLHYFDSSQNLYRLVDGVGVKVADPVPGFGSFSPYHGVGVLNSAVCGLPAGRYNFALWRNAARTEAYLYALNKSDYQWVFVNIFTGDGIYYVFMPVYVEGVGIICVDQRSATGDRCLVILKEDGSWDFTTLLSPAPSHYPKILPGYGSFPHPVNEIYMLKVVKTGVYRYSLIKLTGINTWESVSSPADSAELVTVELFSNPGDGIALLADSVYYSRALPGSPWTEFTRKYDGYVYPFCNSSCVDDDFAYVYGRGYHTNSIYKYTYGILPFQKLLAECELVFDPGFYWLCPCFL